MVFALPGEPGLTELSGDFKVHFHDRQGDFYLYGSLPISETSVSCASYGDIKSLYMIF